MTDVGPLVRTLELLYSRFERRLDAVSTGRDAALYASASAYAQMFDRDPVLRALLRDLDAICHGEWARMRKYQVAHRAATVRAAHDLRAIVLQEDLAHVQYDGRPICEAIDGLISGSDQSPGLDSLAHALREHMPSDALQSAWSPALQEREEVWEASEGEKRRLSVLAATRPWGGLALVRVFIGAADGLDVLSGPGGSSRPEFTSVERGLAFEVYQGLAALLSGSAETSLGRLPPRDELRKKLPVFHSWVVSRLLTLNLQHHSVARYGESVERFRRDEILRLVGRAGAAGKGKRNNEDEEILTRDLARYLHDRGLDPVTEMVLGVRRVDLTASVRLDSDDRIREIVVEAKVMRLGDTRATLLRRLKDGLRKAEDYRRARGQPVGFLVLFWLSEVIPSITARIRTADGTIEIVLVDLRGAPSSRRDVGALEFGQSDYEDWRRSVPRKRRSGK